MKELYKKVHILNVSLIILSFSLLLASFAENNYLLNTDTIWVGGIQIIHLLIISFLYFKKELVQKKVISSALLNIIGNSLIIIILGASYLLSSQILQITSKLEGYAYLGMSIIFILIGVLFMIISIFLLLFSLIVNMYKKN